MRLRSRCAALRRPSRLLIPALAAWCSGTAVLPAAPQLTEYPVPQRVAPGTWLVSGSTAGEREPDGNSVVIEAPAGLIVVDTGRHAWHREALLDLARDRGSPIAAIVNTHWHLDHVSGNPALRARYPRLRVHASNAIDEALGGFLAQSARDAQGYLDDPQLPETLRADIRADRDTIANGAALRPDVVIDRSARRRIAGRLLEVHLAANAATGGDVWLRDPASGVVVLGDLVTLPAPFLDTACPEGWRAALASIAATRFTVAIPGHGGPLGPAQFAQYRAAFDAFIGCAASARGRDACATEWAASVRGLLEAPDTEFERARSMSAYYVDLLRAGGGRSRYCEAPK